MLAIIHISAVLPPDHSFVFQIRLRARLRGRIHGLTGFLLPTRFPDLRHVCRQGPCLKATYVIFSPCQPVGNFLVAALTQIHFVNIANLQAS